MNNIRWTALATVLAASTLASCDSDIDPVYVLPADQVQLNGATGDIVLTPANPQALAMTVYWSGDGRLSLSDDNLQAPVNAAETTIQLSADESFSSPMDIAVDKGEIGRAHV